MPMQNEPETPTESEQDAVSLIIDGHVHTTWSRYQIDSDFLIPADAWSVSLGLPGSVFPASIRRGVPVSVKIGSDTVMVGRVDDVQRNVARQQATLALSGRDGAAVLVDCAAPLFTSRLLGLEEVITQVVRPLGVSNIKIKAESGVRHDKINVEPGERAWDTLVRAAAGRGLWPWFDPDGTLIVGGPDYTTEPVDTLIMRIDGQGNNLLSLNERSSLVNAFSELTLLAQGHAQGSKVKSPSVIDPESAAYRTRAEDDTRPDTLGSPERGFHGLKAVERDPTVPCYRPQIMVVGDADNPEQVKARARKQMSDARLSGYDLVAVVKGHRTASGQLWQPGQRVTVQSEPHGIDATYFVMGRELNGGRPEGKKTTLRLKEDGIWIPDAYATKNKNKTRKTKKSKEQVIIDVE